MGEQYTGSGKQYKSDSYKALQHRRRRRKKYLKRFKAAVMVLCLIAAAVVYGVRGGYLGQQSPEPQVSGAAAGFQTMEVHFLDVGQGDATLVKCGRQALLIDTAEEDKGTAIQYYLQQQGVKRLEYLLLTHPDADHIGSADVILTKFDVGQVLMTDYEKDNSTYRQLIRTLEYRRITPCMVGVGDSSEGNNALLPGDSFPLGDAVCTILAPVAEYEDPNNSSIFLLIEHGANRFLFTGDGQQTAEEDVAEYWEALGISLDADVYKAGHHGSSTSSGEKLLSAVQPDFAVISCGEGNDYGHPHAETMEIFKERGIKVYRTDRQGYIVAVSDGQEIVWQTAR